MTSRQRRITVVLVLIAAPALALTGAWFLGLRLNLTPSYPLGLWRVIPLERPVATGDLIFICPPQTEAFDLARARGYVRPGPCPGWLGPLIKTVAAVAGQQVDIADMVSIDGAPLPYSTMRSADALGRPLMPYPGGVVPPGQLFLHSNFVGSYDSRYFGPIPAEGTLGLAREVLTYAP